MKMWNIISSHFSYDVEMGDKTILHGQHLAWHYLVQAVDDFFNNKHSEVIIFEDEQAIVKKDWQCLYIPFDASVQIDKTTAKSPLKEVQNSASEQLTYSPFFQELQDVLEHLDGELQFLNQELKNWGITSALMPLNEKKLMDFISFNPINTKLSPIEMKKLLLRILLKKPFDKKTLIMIELPEIYASEKDLYDLTSLVNQATEKGYQFLFVTQKINNGSMNYYLEEKVINQALLEEMKPKVINALPFYCSEMMYNLAVEIFFEGVDNFNFVNKIKELSPNDFESLVTIIHVMLYNQNIGSNFDIQGLRPNLKKFMMDYR